MKLLLGEHSVGKVIILYYSINSLSVFFLSCSFRTEKGMLQTPYDLEGRSTTNSFNIWFSCFQQTAIAKLMTILHVSKRSFLIFSV